MSIVLLGSTSGSVTLQEPAIAGSTVIDLPATSGTMAVLPTATSVLPQASGGTGTSVGYNGFKNRIINGAMQIDQRNAGASVTPSPLEYQIDRWRYLASQSSKITMGQNQGSVTPPAGFTNYLGVTSSSAYSLLAADFFVYQQFIEGFNISDLAWGTASATAVTVSFWVRSSLTGTFGGAVQNNGNSRSYPFSYVINSANTWEQKTVTIPGDTSGTWLTTNGRGISLQFGLGVGSTNSGTAGAWSGSDFRSATGATSVVGTNGATFYITGVQLEKGSTATSFDYRPYGTELALCQRYCYRVSGASSETLLNIGAGVDTLSAQFYGTYIVNMRATPTVSGTSLNISTMTGGIIAVTSVGIFNSTPQSYRIALNVASGATANVPYFPRSSGSDGHIQFSAEL